MSIRPSTDDDVRKNLGHLRELNTIQRLAALRRPVRIALYTFGPWGGTGRFRGVRSGVEQVPETRGSGRRKNPARNP